MEEKETKADSSSERLGTEQPRSNNSYAVSRQGRKRRKKKQCARCPPIDVNNIVPAPQIRYDNVEKFIRTRYTSHSSSFLNTYILSLRSK
eukprot:gene9672-6769_t